MLGCCYAAWKRRGAGRKWLSCRVFACSGRLQHFVLRSHHHPTPSPPKRHRAFTDKQVPLCSVCGSTRTQSLYLHGRRHVIRGRTGKQNSPSHLASSSQNQDILCPKTTPHALHVLTLDPPPHPPPRTITRARVRRSAPASKKKRSSNNKSSTRTETAPRQAQRPPPRARNLLRARRQRQKATPRRPRLTPAARSVPWRRGGGRRPRCL